LLILGRPTLLGRDFQRQYNLKPRRCHLIAALEKQVAELLKANEALVKKNAELAEKVAKLSMRKRRHTDFQSDSRVHKYLWLKD